MLFIYKNLINKGEIIMLKTLKGKVVASVAAVLLLAGGTVFGASNAGEKLKEWFDTHFVKSAAVVVDESGSYLNDEMAGLEAELGGLTLDATNQIYNSRDTETKTAKANIVEAAEGHIESIKNTRENLETYMDEEFKSLKANAILTIENAQNKFKEDAEITMGRHTDILGQSALSHVNREITATTNQAIKDIEETISSVKGELLALLAKKADATTDEIKTLIDEAVGETLNNITDMTKRMVKKQTDDIEKKAAQMEEDAMIKMKDLIDGI